MSSTAIDRSKPEKLYCQLLEILREPIEQGAWKVGTRIPTEEQICNQYQVSKTTVRVAIEELVAFGYLNKVQGKGTFVRRRIPEESIRMAIYLNAERMEFNAAHRYHIVEEGIVKPGLEIADYLRLRAEDLCRHFSRVQVLDGMPLALERLHLPCRLCSDGLGELGKTSPLTSCVEGRCAVRIQRMREKTDVPGVNEPEAALLGLAPYTPVLRIRQIFYKAGDLPVGYAEIVRRIDRFGRILEFERL